MQRGSPPPRAGQQNLSPLATERTSSIGAFKSEFKKKKITNASSPVPNGEVTCTHKTDASLMGLCSLLQRSGHPAPRMERGQLTLEITILLSPAPRFSLQTKPVTPVRPVTLLSAAYKEARAGGQRSRDTAYWEKSRLLPGLSGSPLCSRGPDAPSSQGVRSSQRPLKVCSVALGFPSPCQPSAGPPD